MYYRNYPCSQIALADAGDAAAAVVVALVAVIVVVLCP